MTSTTKTYGVEIVENGAPTGTVREVLELRICDYGGNELWSGKAGDEPTYRTPVRKIATLMGDLVGQADEIVDSY